jgi:hypothetical protein
MMWLLFVVQLVFAPEPHVVSSQIVDTFYSEQACREKMQSIFKTAEREKRPVPKEINMGCVPFEKKII